MNIPRVSDARALMYRLVLIYQDNTIYNESFIVHNTTAHQYNGVYPAIGLNSIMGIANGYTSGNIMVTDTNRSSVNTHVRSLRVNYTIIVIKS